MGYWDQYSAMKRRQWLRKSRTIRRSRSYDYAQRNRIYGRNTNPSTQVGNFGVFNTPYAPNYSQSSYDRAQFNAAAARKRAEWVKAARAYRAIQAAKAKYSRQAKAMSAQHASSARRYAEQVRRAESAANSLTTLRGTTPRTRTVSSAGARTAFSQSTLERGLLGPETRKIARAVTNTPYLKADPFRERNKTHQRWESPGPGLPARMVTKVVDEKTRRRLGRAWVGRGVNRRLKNIFEEVPLRLPPSQRAHNQTLTQWYNYKVQSLVSQGNYTVEQAKDLVDSMVARGEGPFDQAEIAEPVVQSLRFQAQRSARARRIAEAQAENADLPWYMDALEWAGKGLAGSGLGALQFVGETLHRPFYAAMYSNRTGGSITDSIRAWTAGMPGLGFTSPGGSTARSAVERTNTWEERDYLTRRGDLQSVGQLLDPTDYSATVPGVDWEFNPISGALDLGFQVAADPLTWVTFGTSAAGSMSARAGAAIARSARKADRAYHAGRLARSGLALTEEAASAAAAATPAASNRAALIAARRAYLTSTPAGRGVIMGLREAINVAGDDARQLARAVRGLTETDAAAALRAGKLGKGTDDAVETLVTRFAEGTFDPKVTLRRQLAAKAGWESAVSARGIPFVLGPKTITKTVGRRGFIGLMDDWANKSGGGADIANRRSAEETFSAGLDDAVAYADDIPFASEVHVRAYGDELDNLTLKQRISRLTTEFADDSKGVYALDTLDEIDAHNVRAVFTLQIQHIVDTVFKSIGDLGDEATALTRQAIREDAKEKVKRLETALAILRGEAGARAADNLVSQFRLTHLNLETHSSPLLRRSLTVARGGDSKLADVLPAKGTKPTISGPRKAALAVQKPTGSYSAPTRNLEILEKNVRGAQGRFNGARRRFQALQRSEPGVDHVGTPEHDDLIKAQRELDLARKAKEGFYDDLNAYNRLKWDYELDRMAEESLQKLRGFGPEGYPATEAHQISLKNRIEANMSSDAAAMLTADIETAVARATGPEDLANIDLFPVLRQVEFLLDPDNADILRAFEKEAYAYRSKRTLLALQRAVAAEEAPGAVVAPLRGFARIVMSIHDKAPAGFIPWIESANPTLAKSTRVDFADRWLGALGFHGAVREGWRRAIGEAQTPDEIITLIREGLQNYAIRFGVPEDEFMKLLDDKLAEAPQRVFMASDDELHQGFMAKFRRAIPDHDERVRLHTRRMVPTQQIQEIRTPDPADVIRLRRKLQAQGRGTAKGLERGFAAGRNLGSEVWSKPRGKSGASISSVLWKGHRFWKFAQVTNLPAVGAGIAAGVWWGDPNKDNESFAERLKFGFGVGAPLGALGSMRYIGRVVGIEERILRWQMVRGANPVDYAPHLARWWHERGVELPFRTYDDLHQLPTEHNILKAWATEGDDYVAYGARNRRYPDAWWRIVNYQVHPESDPVMDALLRAKAGEPTTMGKVAKNTDEAVEIAKNEVREWVANTDDGNVWLRNATTRRDNGPRNIDEVLEAHEAFIDQYLPHQDVIRARLEAKERVDGVVTRGQLKQFIREGKNPNVVHGRNTWTVPRNFAEMKRTLKEMPGRFVLDRPTAKVSREPLARALYGTEYRRLRNLGIGPEEARMYAEEIATTRTNDVMFRIADESRFAKAIDFWFPFQQPREEMIRVYGRLAVEEPGRALRMTRIGALGFNNGVDAGIFEKDEFTGDWVMKVPGSAWLSRVFGAPASTYSFRLKDAFFLLQGAWGSQGSFFDTSETEQALGLLEGVLPKFGGPYWSILTRIGFDAFPEFHESFRNDHPEIYERLFPYGASGRLFRNEARRLWVWLSGQRTAPWEFFSREEQERELRRWEKEAFLQLVWEYHERNPDVEFWMPEAEDVKQRTRALMGAWSAMGSVVPATVRPSMAYKEEFDELIKSRYTRDDGELAYNKLREERPELLPFIASKTKWTGPQTYANWAKDYEERDYFEEYALGHRQHLSLDEFMDDIREGRRRSRLWEQYRELWDIPQIAEREAAMERFRKANPDFNPNSKYERIKALHRILYNTPKSMQHELINNWRRRYDVSYEGFKRDRRDAEDFVRNPWSEARMAEDVKEDVERAVAKGYNEEWYVAHLQPAEQIRYWGSVLQDARYFKTNGYGETMSPQTALDNWYAVKGRMSRVFDEHPGLFRGRWKTKTTPVEKFLQNWKGDYFEATDSISDKIYDEIAPAMDRARESKNWSLYYQLKARRTQLYDMLKAVKNQQYKQLPRLEEFQQDLMAFMQKPAYTGGLKASQVEKLSPQQVLRLVKKYKNLRVPFEPSNEESAFLSMTTPIRRAYIDNLVNKLNVPIGEFDFEVGGRPVSKLFWEYLTDFQKDLLRKNMPREWIEKKMMEDPSSQSSGGGYRRYGYSRPNYYRRYYSRGYGYGGGDPMLSYAYELFRQYTKRPDGAVAPAAYQDYLALPDDPAIRSAFLDKHPEVRDWIASGPMANMPPVLRYIVADIMIRRGKWEGQPMSMTEITELAWAQEQYKRWSRRGKMQRPDTYDKWLRMPTGQRKADYLRKHPEIGRWLRLGPMSNMPEAYQDVVRSIMLRYGQWSKAQDPLGKTLEKFYSIPAHSREQFLERHPEVTAYFDALRTPKEQRIADLTTAYFKLPDAVSRQLFMSAHPELQTHFVESRTRRYENFLMQVAQYMGSNPNLFKQYLKRQEDVLNELLHRFGEVPLIRERYTVTGAKTDTSARSESGRVRK